VLRLPEESVASTGGHWWWVLRLLGSLGMPEVRKGLHGVSRVRVIQEGGFMDFDHAFLGVLLAGNVIVAIMNWRLNNRGRRLLQKIRKLAKLTDVKLPE